MKYLHKFYSLLYIVGCLLLWNACSSTKYIPSGKYLLDRVKIVTNKHDSLSTETYRRLVTQNPNARWFSLFKVPLGVYCWASPDSTGWWNKLWHKLGEAPVIYNEESALKSAEAMTRQMQSNGYMAATTQVETKMKRHKVSVRYRLRPGTRYRIKSFSIEADKETASFFNTDTLKGIVPKAGDVFDLTVLDALRETLATQYRNRGYYKFEPNYLSYLADTVAGTGKVDLTLRIVVPSSVNVSRYKIGKINFVLDANLQNIQDHAMRTRLDSIHYKDFTIYFHRKLHFRPTFLKHNTPLATGQWYNEENVAQTRNRFGRMRIFNYNNVLFQPDKNDSTRLSTYILLNRAKEKAVSAELEGTNTAGDLGAAASVSFEHKNLFKGAEVFSLKLRGAYEAITGLEGYANENYTEWGVEAALKFPSFLFPFTGNDFRHRSRASTELSLQYDMQNRPEFKRRVASANLNYQWTTMEGRLRHKVDAFNLDYVYMPWISPTFRHEYLDSIGNQNAILKYNYENLFIASMRYSINFNSRGGSMMTGSTYGTNAYAIRASVESAGNILYPLFRLAGARRVDGKSYGLFQVPFAQYVKTDFDFVKSVSFDPRNSMAFHIGLGVAVPYGNATMLPFEKRYFSGGANSVRGWNVRTLGPGSFKSQGGKIDFINQSGDIRLDLNMEYRTFLFWKLHGAVFVDAGNIWTIRSYSDQPGGAFQFSTFYKEIAVAYGIGIRFNFDYFILRFDGGMKAVNPAYTTNRDHFPLLHPNFKRDFAFHFAVGLPF